MKVFSPRADKVEGYLLTDSQPSITRCAKQFRRNKSTIQEQLRREGTQYLLLSRAVMVRRAMAMLEQGMFASAVMASMRKDSSWFRDKFFEATGCTQSEYRRKFLDIRIDHGTVSFPNVLRQCATGVERLQWMQIGSRDELRGLYLETHATLQGYDGCYEHRSVEQAVRLVSLGDVGKALDVMRIRMPADRLASLEIQALPTVGRSVGEPGWFAWMRLAAKTIEEYVG